MVQFRIDIILILGLSCLVLLIQSCFEPFTERKNCYAEILNRKPPVSNKGYDFGFGSLNETESMCRTRWPIKIWDCILRRLNKNCEGKNFYLRLWELSFDIEKFKKGVNYLCETHNMRIFNEQKECLLSQEKNAQKCIISKDYIAKALEDLKNSTTKDNSDNYYEKFNRILVQYKCKNMKTKLSCLFDLLHKTCPTDATILILNYFKMTLPSNCYYTYKVQLDEYNRQNLVKQRQIQQKQLQENEHQYQSEGYYQTVTTKSKNNHNHYYSLFSIINFIFIIIIIYC